VTRENKTKAYEKQVAVILPRWVLDMMINQLDTQYDSLVQEKEYYESVADQAGFSNAKEEIALYERAIKQIDSQLNS